VENRGIRVNVNKTKVMISGERQKLMQKAARWQCGVCGRTVGSNALQCTSCQKWVHNRAVWFYPYPPVWVGLGRYLMGFIGYGYDVYGYRYIWFYP